MPLITQDKRKPGAVKQEPEDANLNNLLGFCRLGILHQWRRKEGRREGEDGERGAFVRVWESTVRCGSQPCPLGLCLSRGHEQRLFPSYCPGLVFKGIQAATAIPLAACRHCCPPTGQAPPGQDPQACTPRELDWGPEELYVAKITLLSHFPNFPGVLHLCLTPRLPLLASTWGM